MVSQYTYKKLTWVDMTNPTPEEVRDIAERFAVPAGVAQDLLTSTMRSKVEVHPDMVFLILHFPQVTTGSTPTPDHEIDFILGRDYIITVHYQLSEPLERITRAFEIQSMNNKIVAEHAGYLFYDIIRELYATSFIQLETIDNDLARVEHGIFDSKEKFMVRRISEVNKKLIDFRQSLRFHREALRSFELPGKNLYGSGFAYQIESIMAEFNKLQTMLEIHTDLLHDLRETNDSLLSAKTNETIKALTVMSVIMLPLTLITGIFGMNANFVLIHQPSDFLFVIGAMVATGVVMLLFIKGKKWL